MTLAEVKKAAEGQYLRQVENYAPFNAAPEHDACDREESAPTPNRDRRDHIDLNRERRSVNILLNYIDLLEKELHRQRTQIRSLSRELNAAKVEINILREDRDHWIKQHSEDISNIYKTDKNAATALVELRNEILSIKKQLVSN